MDIIGQVRAAQAKNPNLPITKIFKDLKVTPSRYYTALRKSKTQAKAAKPQSVTTNVNPLPGSRTEMSMLVGTPEQIAEVLRRQRH